MAHLPQCRVKTIMKTSEQCLLISKESLLVMVKAAELFIKELAVDSYNTNKTKKITYNHVVEAVEEIGRYSFLENIVPRKITVKQYKKIMAAKKRGNTFEEDSSSSSSEESSSSSSSDEEPMGGSIKRRKVIVADVHVTAETDSEVGTSSLTVPTSPDSNVETPPAVHERVSKLDDSEDIYSVQDSDDDDDDSESTTMTN